MPIDAVFELIGDGLVAEGTETDFELFVKEDRIVVYLWLGAKATVFHDGIELGDSNERGRFPPSAFPTNP
jgi:hypothetical protein